jgi:hypothetical protein
MSEDELYARAYELTQELDISGLIRLEMLAEPELAVAVLEHALASPRIRNRAGFAVANWKAGFDPRPSSPSEEEPELELGPPTLEALEHAWSLEPSPPVSALLAAIAAALTHFGGFAPLQRELYRVTHPDA